MDLHWRSSNFGTILTGATTGFVSRIADKITFLSIVLIYMTELSTAVKAILLL
jgi:hypothetical protein